MIYMDHNATTPVSPEVMAEMYPYFMVRHGNPSSNHVFGRVAREAVEKARGIIADAIGARASEIYFTSGGTEANNMALRGAILYDSNVFISPIEHHSILRTIAAMRAIPSPSFVNLSYVDVLNKGQLDFADFAEKMQPQSPSLVSIMLANNETGNLIDVKRAVEMAKAANESVIFHTDAVQAFGKIPINVDGLGVDMMTISGHKINAPKGIGALYVREGTKINPLLEGGHQERDMRAGTENVAGIVGFGKAAEMALENGYQKNKEYTCLARYLMERIYEHIEGVRVNTNCGIPLEFTRKYSIGNTINLSFPGVDGEALCMMLDLHGICVSHGAACEAGQSEPSHVLKAMGQSDQEAQEAVRISLGLRNTYGDMDEVAAVLSGVIAEMRG